METILKYACLNTSHYVSTNIFPEISRIRHWLTTYKHTHTLQLLTLWSLWEWMWVSMPKSKYLFLFDIELICFYCFKNKQYRTIAARDKRHLEFPVYSIVLQFSFSKFHGFNLFCNICFAACLVHWTKCLNFFICQKIEINKFTLYPCNKYEWSLVF